MTPQGTVPDPWMRVASLADLRSRGRVRVEVDGRDVLLVHTGGQVYACGNVCAHQHFPMLHAGTLEGHRVTCPMHGWTFDVRTGASAAGEGRIPVYPVLVRGDDVLIAAA